MVRNLYNRRRNQFEPTAKSAAFFVRIIKKMAADNSDLMRVSRETLRRWALICRQTGLHRVADELIDCLEGETNARQ